MGSCYVCMHLRLARGSYERRQSGVQALVIANGKAPPTSSACCRWHVGPAHSTGACTYVMTRWEACGWANGAVGLREEWLQVGRTVSKGANLGQRGRD